MVDRDDPMTHYNLGMVLSLMGKTDESADQFRRALSLKPDDRDARQQLGRVLSQGGREPAPDGKRRDVTLKKND